ncbi:ATP-binding cassette domain-containing protein, partial [Nonomuraea sp. NPDC055795]
MSSTPESKAAVTDRSAHVAGAENAVLRCDELIAGYLPGVNILNGSDLYVGEGELIGIIGPNGAGKSTRTKAVLSRALGYATAAPRT